MALIGLHTHPLPVLFWRGAIAALCVSVPQGVEEREPSRISETSREKVPLQHEVGAGEVRWSQWLLGLTHL